MIMFLIPFLLLATGTLQAAACTWNEAIMAYENDNPVRGLALMRMAASDGDVRATRYLAGIGDRIVNPVISDTLMAGNTADNMADHTDSGVVSAEPVSGQIR